MHARFARAMTRDGRGARCDMVQSRDAFKRLFTVSKPSTPATPASLVALMGSPAGAGIRKYIGYLLEQ